MPNIKKLLVFIFLFVSLKLQAIDIKSIGVPYIENHSKSTYAAGNQNWSIAKDNNGILYFGNNDGLLVFDGKYWQKHQMPNRQIVRAVATDGKGKIYAGGFGEFGYWAVKNNRLKYHSLVTQLPKGNSITDEIWKIYVDKDRVIFQSFSKIIILKNNKIEVVKSPSSFLFLHRVNNRFIVEVLEKGLFELIGNKLVHLANSEKLGKEGVLSILPYKNNGFLIGTSKNGLFTYDGKDFATLNSSANDFVKTYQLNNGVSLGKYFAFGTILNGLIIIDENGRVVQRINKSSGLQNNTVLSIYADNDQNLWTGLDNGIDRIELNSPLYFYFDKTGLFGTVYSSIIFNNKIYLGTNQGLFYSDWSTDKELQAFNFRLIPNSQGQVWDLSVIDNELICGHNSGTFKVIGDRIEKISAYGGGWTIKKLNSNPNLYIQGNYNGITLFSKSSEKELTLISKITGFDAPSRYVEQDTKGDIWASHAYKGLYKLILSPDYKRVINKKYFDEKNGLPGNYNINIFNLENRIVFSSDSGFYTYDEFSNKFSKYEVLNKNLGSFSTSNKIIKAGERKYWFINHGKTALVDFAEAGKIEIDSNQFSLMDGRMVQYYENISRINSSIYLISIDDGFVIYNTLQNKQSAKIVLPKVLIRNIDDITDKFRVISEVGNGDAIVEINNSRNNIRISYSLPYYRQSKIKYQFYMEGYSKEWSDWNYATQKDFTNLSSGTYTFKVRAKLDDSTITEISSFEFTILRPWYLSNWAIFFYLFALAIVLVLGKKIYERKLETDRLKISKRLQTEQEEIIKLETEANEKQIIRLQTEKLQAELASKNRELANSAMTLVYKNELLQKLSDEITKLKDESGKKLSEDQTRKIQKVINDGMNDERDWNLFENSFNEAHESFFKKLKAQHPDLVPNDLKLCAYLRMNMSSKEMSSLLNITLRGVEIRRYRLRKKLGVPHDKNLTEFLMEL